MPRKKKETEIDQDISVDVPVDPQEPEELSELTVALARQHELLLLREALTREKIDSIGQLDVILGRVNQRLKELTV